MSRAGLGLALVWLLCAAPLFLPRVLGSEVSPLALAILPWLVWASLPRSGSESGLVDRLAPALAAPLVVLALALERARGREWGVTLAPAGGLVLLALLYFAAARRTAASRAGRRLYALAWFALIAGAPLLAATLESAGAPLFGGPPGWLATATQLSPLSYWLTRLHTGLPGAALELPWVALALAAALWLAGRALEARA